MVPLSEQLRPQELNEIFGQDHLLKEEGLINRIIKSKKPLSLLFYGPPGCGKTTIARLYAKSFNASFQTLSAVFCGVSDLKKIFNDIKDKPLLNRCFMLFVDEIHRFNKSQQDAFLPYIEDGTIILIGATTENPSFALNDSLLSRLIVLTLNPLSFNDLEKILITYEKKVGTLNLGKEEREYLIDQSKGDGRYLLNLIENIQSFKGKLNLENLQRIVQTRPCNYDKKGDNHYNLISALHKSVRGSDPDAAIYWFSRMIQGGEDPLYLARRLIRMATEDIGLADPNALNIAIAGHSAYQILGSPEGELALAEVVIYLALAPKSNSIYLALNDAQEEAKKSSQLSVPLHILNAPTKWMKEMGYSNGYIYDHDTKEGIAQQEYFPEQIERKNFYFPVERGFEREMIKRMQYFKKIKKS